MINFNTVDIKYKLKNKPAIKKWISEAAKNENSSIGHINIVFCDDNYLLGLNEQYLNHNTFTDIITFDYSDETSISGDIFISLERITDNAKKYKVAFEEELQRVMIHGILHLCGYKDKTKADKANMTAAEDKYLAMLGDFLV
ncbi:MAG: rRNA maturation RNase YbeY [Bacteroidetes bacterium]|nr:rRNA maturation RNase YbeY [Bacteroidota bacterium]